MGKLVNAKNSIFKKTVAVLLLASVVSVASADIFDVLRDIPKIPEIPEIPEVPDTADEALDSVIPVSDVQQKHMCGMSSTDTAAFGLREKIKSVTTKQLLKAVSKSLNVDGIELPEKIESPCYAEVRWDYAERKSAFWAEKVVFATNKALEALDIDHQIEADRLFAEGTGDETPSSSEFVTMREELDRGLELVNKGIAEKEEINEVLLAEATGAMRGAMTYGAEILGWDQRLLEYMGENIRWTMNRKARLNNFKEHATLLSNTVGSMQKVSAATRASETDGIVLESASKAEEERIAQENIAFEAQLATELDL
jgi:hypothetical protein